MVLVWMSVHRAGQGHGAPSSVWRLNMRSLKFAAVAAGVIGLATPAFAADISVPVVPAPAPAPAPLVYDWTGFYVGVHAGGDIGGEYEADITTPGNVDDKFDSDGFLGGGQIGFNYQMNQFVIGAEADFSFTGIDGDGTIDIPGLGDTAVDAETDWISTIRARLGYAFDNFLVYGTGGIAFANVEVSEGLTGSDDDNTHIGYALGAGIEAGLTQNVSLRAEYLYLDFEEEDISLAGGAVTGDASADNHILRAAINYRFNFGGGGF